MSIKPFSIAVLETDLERLYQKLDAATFPDERDNAGWDMGVPLAEIKRLTAYWRDGFNWREHEQKLNDDLKQFTVPVPVDGFEDLDIHYLHHTSKTPGAIPLLFLHGWPGSFKEATKLIPLLTSGDDNKPAFDVIAPGFGLHQYAEAIHGVMTSLGYKEYVIQGGDWGSFIARKMARLYPQHTKAIHLNFITLRFPMPWENPSFFLTNLLPIPFSQERKAYLSSVIHYFTKENGYMIQQATRPQTINYALADSPVALLAWIYDKLHLWTDGYSWTDDEILTWSLLKVVSKPAPDSVKIGVAQFKEEVMRYPMSWTKLLGNVVRATGYPRGGHFAAWEVHELLVGNLQQFLGRDGPAFGVVTGKNGF
ncbi:putative epoxide hydrolase [Aspergillus californicus]